MEINIGALFGEIASLKQEEDIPLETVLPAGIGYTPLSFLRVKVKVTKAKESMLVEGSLQVSLRFMCMRCLEHFDKDLSTEFREEYTRHARKKEAILEQLLDMQAPTYEGDTLDLSDLIGESLVLALPMKVLCSTECLGLCSSCGKPKAKEECDCASSFIDPRLAPLAEFLKDKEGRN